MKPDRNPAEAAIGAELRRRRRAMRTSLADIGATIGVTYQQMQKYERGQNRISALNLARLAVALRCTPADLLLPVTEFPDGVPPPPTARALRLDAQLRPLTPDLQDTVERIVGDLIDVHNRAALNGVARDGHPALSYAH